MGELTSDLIAIQGLLSSIVKNTGEFEKINFIGGNEDKVLTVMREIQKYLTSKRYLIDAKINEDFDAQLEDIVFFLAINVVYKHKLILENYSHLMNIIPPLSKCMFVNVVYGLDLIKYYCQTIERVPIEISTELLDEAIHCLKKSLPKIHLNYACMFLKAAARKLESINYSVKVEEDVDNLTRVTNIMLLNLTGLYPDHATNMKAKQIYQHMGYCLMNLFDLLLYCDKNCIVTKKFVENIFRTCCSIVMNVTLHVYCAWVEVEVDGENLQTLIAGKAYLVTQAYLKCSAANELISMLGSIAKKPLTLMEQIQRSDVEMIIKKVHKADGDQKSWFRALLTTQVLKNPEAVNCIDRWAHLCSDEDVTLLLNLCIQTSDETPKKLVTKCASTLSVDQLHQVLTRHFHRNKFHYILEEKIEHNLMLICNKLSESSNLQENLVTEMCLLFLKNPLVVFRYTYSECLKNTYYTDWFLGTFKCMNEISKIDDVGVNTFNEVIKKDKLTSQNYTNCAYLLKKLIEIDYFTVSFVLSKILYPDANQYFEEGQIEELSYILQIILEMGITIPVTDETKDIICWFLKVMVQCRCTFLNFNRCQQEIVKYIIDIFMDLCDVNISSSVEACEEEDCFTNYYKKYLSCDTNSSFLISVCPKFDIMDYGGCVCCMLQVLPLTVPREWLKIANEVVNECNGEKCIELFTDVLILLSQFVDTQNAERNGSVFAALRYFIQNFGLTIQQSIQKNSEIDTEVCVSKQVCRLLAKLPVCLREEEGLALVNVLTSRSLKALHSDKDFLCHLILIKNSKICKTLAERIKN